MPFTYAYANLIGTFTGSASEVNGVRLDGVAPGQKRRIIGAMPLATLEEGVNTGIAGTGTTSTSLVKPTGAPSWEFDGLWDKWVRIVGGGGGPVDGAPVLRKVYSNNGSTITFKNPVIGLNNTSEFQIVDLETVIVGSLVNRRGVDLRNCLGPIEIYGVKFGDDTSLDTLISAVDCASVLIEGCDLGLNLSLPSVLGQRCTKFEVNNCYATGSADVKLSQCQYVLSAGHRSIEGGLFEVEDAFTCDIKAMVANDAPSRVLSMTRIISGSAEVLSENAGATPVYLESVSNFIVTGTALTGSGNTGYGIEVARSGNLTFTGSTITGTTGDVNFMGTSVSWADVLSSPNYGMVTEHAGSALAYSSYTKALVLGARTFVGPADFSSRVLEFGYHNFAANTVVPTLTGTQELNMETGQIDGSPGGLGANPRACLEVISSSATASIVLPSNAAIAGIMGTIDNRGGSSVILKSSSGGTVNGAATKTLGAGGFCFFVSRNGTGGKDFRVFGDIS